jgi:hypothetical protein
MEADMAAQRAACERQIAAGRDRFASASAAFRAALHSDRSGAGQNLSRQGMLPHPSLPSFPFSSQPKPKARLFSAGEILRIRLRGFPL